MLHQNTGFGNVDTSTAHMAAKTRITSERTYVCPHAGPGINSYYNTALEHEPQCGSSVSWLYTLNHLSFERINLRGTMKMQPEA